MRLPKFEYHAPSSLEAALRVLEQEGQGAYVLAGGTDLLVKMTLGGLKPRTVVDVKGIKCLDEVRFRASDGLAIGATARIEQVESHPDVVRYYPALASAAQVMANVQVRNMGTIAGNLCNAAPSAENAPPLMALGATVKLASLKGERTLPLDGFFRGPGLTAIEPGEIMTSIHVPPPSPRSGNAYQRISARCGVDIAAVCVGVLAVFDGDACSVAKIVLGAVAPVPMHATEAEELLQGKKWTADLLEEAGRKAMDEAKPISDVRATASYRKQMVNVLTIRALQEAYERI